MCVLKIVFIYIFNLVSSKYITFYNEEIPEKWKIESCRKIAKITTFEFKKSAPFEYTEKLWNLTVSDGNKSAY